MSPDRIYQSSFMTYPKRPYNDPHLHSVMNIPSRHAVERDRDDCVYMRQCGKSREVGAIQMTGSLDTYYMEYGTIKHREVE